MLPDRVYSSLGEEIAFVGRENVQINTKQKMFRGKFKTSEGGYFPPKGSEKITASRTTTYNDIALTPFTSLP